MIPASAVIPATQVRRALAWTLACLAPLAALALAAGFAFSPDALAGGAPWASLGLEAPSCAGCWLCGMSRAFAALGHGQLADAVRHNPLVLAAWPMAWAVALGGGWFLVRTLTAGRIACRSRP
jgi:hypothetical protein